jgi:TRAP transporter TAXI family solute receptor
MAEEPPSIVIGTGNLLGVYYPTGGAICRRVRETTGPNPVPCREVATPGSLYNLSVLRRGFPSMNMAVVQADVLYHAIRGDGPFERAGPDPNTRTMLVLAPEAFNIVARSAAFGTGLRSLRNMRVALGAFGSGQQPTVDTALAAAGLDRGVFRAVEAFSADDQAFELCRNRIDAFVFVAATPSASVQQATATCGAQLIGMPPEAVQQLVAEFPYFRAVTISGGTYQGNDQPVSTFGVLSILATRARTSPDLVYLVVKAVMDDLPAIRRLHPALAHLRAEEMVPSPDLAPLHPGAVRYFREKGLLE